MVRIDLISAYFFTLIYFLTNQTSSPHARPLLNLSPKHTLLGIPDSYLSSSVASHISKTYDGINQQQYAKVS